MQIRHRHIPELQSIRGLAALVVLLEHCSFLFETSQSFHLWAEVLFNAHAAVMVFFVLSGYVLARSLAKEDLSAENCARFYIWRLFRIYPALFAACAIAAAYAFLIHFRIPTLSHSAWYSQYLPRPPMLADIVKNAASTGNFLIPPVWTVHIELLASAAIPLICIANRHRLGSSVLFASVALALLASATGHLGFLPYLPSFVVGTTVWTYQDRLARIHMLGSPMALSLSAITLMFFRRIDPAWAFDPGYFAVTPTLVESLAAALLIAGIVSHPISVLRHPLAIRLGDISYSLYLIHFIVMSALAKIIGVFTVEQDIRPLLLMVSTLAVSWPLAAIAYSYIEKPGILAGRKFWNSLSISLGHK